MKTKEKKGPEPIPGIHIPTRFIRAALLFTAKQDIRYYLNGVLFAPTENGESVHVVATDGYRMFAAEVKQERAVSKSNRAPMILARDDLQAAVRGKTNIADTMVIQGVDTASKCRRLFSASKSKPGTWHLAEIIKADYPLWQRILIDAIKADQGAAALNHQYVSDAIKVDVMLSGGNGRCPQTSFHLIETKADGKAAVIRFDDPSAIGLIMPMRVYDTEARSLPLWATTLTTQKDDSQ